MQTTSQRQIHSARLADQPWEARDREIAEKVKSYMTQFQHTDLHRQSAAEGWTRDLEAYVREAAFIQAQLIAGVSNVQFTNLVVPTAGYTSAREAFQAWRHGINEQVMAGRIDVAVPTGKIQEWREQAIWRAANPPPANGIISRKQAAESN